MRTKILKIQKSAKPIWETKLSIDGIINGKDNIPPTEQAYEMVLSIFEDEDSLAPIKNIVINTEHHANNIAKYGMDALLRGVNLVSMLSITEHPDIKHEGAFDKEVEAIAYSIVGRMEQDTFFNNYNPGKMREYIEEKIIRLKDKFRIESK